jgi:hypothetical protein
MQSRFTTSCPKLSVVGRLLQAKGIINRRSHSVRKAACIRFLDRVVGHMRHRSLLGDD